MMHSLKLLENFSSYLQKSDKSKLTIKNYSSDLRHFFRWYEEKNDEVFSVARVTPADMRLYKNYLLENSLKPQTINRRIISLKLFFGWVSKDSKELALFPMPKPVKQTALAPKWLSKNEQHALLRAAQHEGVKSRDAAIIVILLNTGLRVGELCALCWNDIKISSRSGILTVRSGKGQKRREVPLNKDAREAFITMGYDRCAGSLESVFIGQRGSLTPRGVQLALKGILKGSEIDISPHVLRHSFCKNLINSGIGLEKVALLAGHESLDVTKLYCQPAFSELAEAVERISGSEG